MTIFSLLLNGSMLAQKSANFDKIELYHVDRFENSISDIPKAITALSVSKIENLEESMNYEHWMIRPLIWSENTELDLMDEMFFDAEMDFEGWMFESSWITGETFSEEELQYESWMLTPCLWL